MFLALECCSEDGKDLPKNMRVSESWRQELNVGKIRMNIRNKYSRKITIYLSAIFCLSVVAGFVQAQPKMPTQKDLDALDVALKNMPTTEQNAELSKIADDFQKKYGALNSEFDILGAEIEHVTQSSRPNYLLTKSHIQAAMVNHKKLRALYLEHFQAVAGWARQSGRTNCANQTERMRLYTIRVSDQWLRKVAALPLGTVQDRAYAGLYVGTGGGDITFQPDPEPVIDARYSVGMELIGLDAVCSGSKPEYVPGTE